MRKNYLKHFSIISITSKWIESSRLVFPRPKFFKVFKENLKMCAFLFKVLKKNPIMEYIHDNENLIYKIPSLFAPLLPSVVQDPKGPLVKSQWDDPVGSLFKIY